MKRYSTTVTKPLRQISVTLVNHYHYFDFSHYRREYNNKDLCQVMCIYTLNGENTSLIFLIRKKGRSDMPLHLYI